MAEKPTLLIVDDDSSDHVLMQQAFKRRGYDMAIDIASSAEEGIRKAAALRAGDLIVMDSTLPGMDGFDACKKIKGLNSKINIIICTGAVDEIGQQRAKESGANDYCLKTFDYEVLISSIETINKRP